MQQDVKRFGVAVLVFVTLLAAVDIAIGVVSDNLMSRLPDYGGQLSKDNYRLHHLDAEVVVLGSSRANHHYVSRQLNDSLDRCFGRSVSLYNAAIDGMLSNSNSCAAECLVARYRPQLVIYDVTEEQLRMGKVSDLEFSAPYYWRDSVVHRYLDDLGVKERVLMKSSLYRYNGKTYRLASSLLRSTSADDGYEPLSGVMTDVARKAPVTGGMDAYAMSHFVGMLERYRSAGVPLVVVSSPRFRPTDNNRMLRQLCEEHHTLYIDMYDDTVFNGHPEWFQDEGHLNDSGARVFTARLFVQLKPHLSK